MPAVPVPEPVAEPRPPGAPEHADGRWLTDEQQVAWRRLAGVMSVLPSVLDAQLQRDADLTHYAYWVLAMLSETPDRSLRMSELAARSNSSPSRLSHVVARLERSGWVRRSPAEADGRGSVATLTDTGLAKVRAAAPGHVQAVRNLVFDRLDDADARDLARVCGAVLEGLGQAGGTTSGPDGGSCPV